MRSAERIMVLAHNIGSMSFTALDFSEPSVNGKGRQYEYQHADDGPYKWNPGRHFKVSSLVNTTQQSSHDGSRHKCLNAPNKGEQWYSDPYQFPIAPLHNACPQCSYEVYTTNKEEGPIYSEAEDVAGLVKIYRPGGACW